MSKIDCPQNGTYLYPITASVNVRSVSQSPAIAHTDIQVQ